MDTTQSALPVRATANDQQQWLARGIVVGIDGSEASIEALRCALRLGLLAGTTVRAVAVWQPLPFGSWGASPYQPVKKAVSILTLAVARVCGTHVPEWFTAMPQEGLASDVLIENSRDADLLIVGTRGRTKMTGMLLGSVSATCVSKSACPVLVVNQRAALPD